VPAEVDFATKPQLAAEMIDAALEAGVDASWVCADEVPAIRASHSVSAAPYASSLVPNSSPGV
jgi:hypothetical protein